MSSLTEDKYEHQESLYTGHGKKGEKGKEMEK